MPAKRSSKKSRKPSSKPSLVDVTPTDLDALAAVPEAPVALSGPVTPVALPERAGTPPPPKAGPPAGREARFAGRSQRAGQARFYAFRRS